MSTTLNELHQEHINITRLMDVFENQIEQLEENGHVNLQLIRDITDYIMHYPDLYHHPKEDLIFKLLRHKDKEIEPVINHLLDEHKTLTDMAINLNDILSRFDEKEHTHILIDLLREYIYLIRSHMDVEESKSFPRAKQVLTDDDWSEIDEGFSYKDDPLFGKIIYKQYQDIYDSIVNF